MTLRQQLVTVMTFTKINTARFFRDRLALFFGILFPLIFLVILGSLSKGSGAPTFNVALLNQSATPFARQFSTEIKKNKTYKVDPVLTTLKAAKDKMSKSQIDGIIILPPNFGVVDATKNYPTGHIKLLYAQSSAGAGQTLTSVLNGSLTAINNKLVGKPPLTVTPQIINQKQLSPFDYTFAGLLGFSIIGLGIFGPINVFPELKKQGILRRLHTTPLRVWQYFLSTMFSQALIGLISVGIQFAVALTFFGLKVDGNYAEIALFVMLSVCMILGIGLAIGGWAKNERQAAPLGNIVVFPMLFLSGTFFPRFGMPQWLQNISTYLPLTPVIDGLRQLTTEGKHLLDIGPQLGLIGIWMIVIYAIAFRVFRWE